ncbi:MAG TPA: YtxH domain-containing protein [Candidatus Pseudogracilibacillus intestinigallinarum]|uniref:YtxH domain-containing protein n=1 Tax=Candidatus Pseudogracilibacillus intestinigallinarum TaxID=2838742 RepID=A0A9D1PP63_9BACI|nr:YtxH domain-containing protein [Candidatus Pseudogracilibacillus intestinigallinarum]
MGKRKLLTGIIAGAAIGGVVSLFNKETRAYAKDGLVQLKDNVTDCIANPSEVIDQMKDTVQSVSSFVENNVDGAVNTLEQVESTVNRFLK